MVEKYSKPQESNLTVFQIKILRIGKIKVKSYNLKWVPSFKDYVNNISDNNDSYRRAFRALHQ
jgi:hypothetical protein